MAYLIVSDLLGCLVGPRDRQAQRVWVLVMIFNDWLASPRASQSLRAYQYIIGGWAAFSSSLVLRHSSIRLHGSAYLFFALLALFDFDFRFLLSLISMQAANSIESCLVVLMGKSHDFHGADFCDSNTPSMTGSVRGVHGGRSPYR